MATCEYGTKNCVHAGKPHDEDCCFDGWYRHKYICQECGNTMQSTKQRAHFPPKDCDKCGSEKSMT